jgi:hypothetical protein
MPIGAPTTKPVAAPPTKTTEMLAMNVELFVGLRMGPRPHGLYRAARYEDLIRM